MTAQFGPKVGRSRRVVLYHHLPARRPGHHGRPRTGDIHRRGRDRHAGLLHAHRHPLRGERPGPRLAGRVERRADRRHGPRPSTATRSTRTTTSSGPSGRRRPPSGSTTSSGSSSTGPTASATHPTTTCKAGTAVRRGRRRPAWAPATCTCGPTSSVPRATSGARPQASSTRRGARPTARSPRPSATGGPPDYVGIYLSGRPPDAERRVRQQPHASPSTTG